MKKLNLNYNNSLFEQSFDLPNPGLRSYFGRVEKGQPDEYRTTFYKGKSLDWIIDTWSDQLSTIQSEYPTLWDFEMDLATKVGPMSIMKPLKDRIVDVESYYSGVTSPGAPIGTEAISHVVQEFSKLRGMRLRSPQNTVNSMKLSTNSGSPFFAKRRNVLSNTLPFTIDAERSTFPHDHSYTHCAVLGWRGQEGGRDKADVKQRVVWMFPFAVNIAELQVYQPLIEMCQHFHLVPAWESMEAVDARITKLFDTKASSDLVICTDFSKFDQHFNSNCAEAAQTILRSIMTTNQDSDYWLNEIFPIKYNIPIAINWNRVVVGHHGMASGSGGTNADETLTHRALQYEAAIRAGSILNPNSQCLGDDGMISYPGCTVEDVTRSYTEHGLEMNLSKQYASAQDCTYLRRWHSTTYRRNGICVGVYSTCRALGRLAEQERFYDEGWSKEAVVLRMLSIIENCKFHPLREQFADFCIKGDRYRIGLDIPGFLDPRNLKHEVKKTIDKIPDFMGYTKTMQSKQNDDSYTEVIANGIDSWWIVQYLRSKA